MQARIAKNLTSIRAKTGYSTNQFAEIIGISQPAYSNLENGKSLPRAETLVALYEKFQVDPLWLLTGQTRTKITEPDAVRLAEIAQQLTPDARQRLIDLAHRELQLETILAEKDERQEDICA